MTYDAAGRVTSLTDELGTVSYEYDANGNVLKVTDEGGSIERKYDALNRVTEYTDYNGNTVKYAYDEIGNLISLTYPGGEIVRYTYYKNGWLETVTDSEGRVTSYEYDANGNLTHTTRANGTEEFCTYNEAGLLVAQKDVKGEEVLTHYTYTYDARGNIASVEGTETTAGDLTRLASATMTYDAANRLLTYNGEALRYDADGNMTYGPVNGLMSELIYDCRNRLVSAGGVSYTYDPENTRIAAETDSYREVYVTESVASSLSRILSATRYEKTAGEAALDGETTLYIYGNGLVYEYSEDTILYHHYNNLGSTVKLTDEDGQVIETYTYGVYGELLSGDTTLTRFLYNGRCGVSTDDNGLYYMRQRYYNPEIKRFVNQDILTGSIGNSQSLNRYSYVQGNPVSYTDPFGLSPLNGLFSGTMLTHTVCELLGWIPGPVGSIANAVDGLVYLLVDKDYKNALYSLGSSVSFGAGKLVAWAGKGSKTALRIQRVCNFAGSAINFAQSAEGTVNMGGMMIDKYIIQGQPFDDSTAMEFLFLGANIFGATKSGAAMATDVRDFGKFAKMAGIPSLKGDNRGVVNAKAFIDAFKESGSKPIGATYEGTIYRSVNSKYDPLEMSQYTVNSNHRYTESGVPGLYFSSGEKIVKAELGNYDVFDFSNRTMYSYDVRLKNMLDVSNPSVRSQMGISLESIVGESYDVTHAVGRYAYSNGYNGIIAPSARADGGINIILFNAKGVK